MLALPAAECYASSERVEVAPCNRSVPSSPTFLFAHLLLAKGVSMITDNSLELTQTKLKEHLYYDPETGIFEWIKISKYHLEKLNNVAGTRQPSRNKLYIVISLDGKKHRA